MENEKDTAGAVIVLVTAAGNDLQSFMEEELLPWSAPCVSEIQGLHRFIGAEGLMMKRRVNKGKKFDRHKDMKLQGSSPLFA